MGKRPGVYYSTPGFSLPPTAAKVRSVVRIERITAHLFKLTADTGWVGYCASYQAGVVLAQRFFWLLADSELGDVSRGGR